MTLGPEHRLIEIGRAIEEAIDKPNATERQLLADLRHQMSRLREHTFQLAVLGQFKRGKSTLLNAFVGYPLLSAGVLPLTAVPTFLAGGTAKQIRLSYLSGAVEQHDVETLAVLGLEIAAATTEEQNPHNEKGLQRVDVAIPGNAWLDSITLIDTPGIGSTHTHNTEAAYAVLPECDAALFVCSVDPPITEVELDYLVRICRTVSRVIVVLNKIDLVDGGDRTKAIEFLSSIVAARPEQQVDRRVFAVSARHALTARQAGDITALDASGLLALEEYVRVSLVDQKRHFLMVSIANKMSETTAALLADAAMTASALSLPLAELETTVAAFEQAVVDFERQRNVLDDSINGEWRRAVTRLSTLSGAVDKRAQQQLNSVIAGISDFKNPDAARSTVTSAMTAIFDREFGQLATTVETELAVAIAEQQRHYQTLAARVRETAGTLLKVTVPSAAPDDWFQIRREPYWVGERRVESLSSLTIDGLARLLPAAWRRRRQRKRFEEAVANALTRNISDLQWTMRQNIDDSFRRLLSASHDAVETSVAATRELLRIARERRRAEDDSLQHDIERARFVERRLVHLQTILSQEGRLCRQ